MTHISFIDCCVAYSYPCGLLPCDRRNKLKSFYSTISDPSLLDVPGSPQSLALDWIVSNTYIYMTFPFIYYLSCCVLHLI